MSWYDRGATADPPPRETAPGHAAGSVGQEARKGNGMRVTRLYADDDGESKFGEIDIPLKEASEVGSGSDLIDATGVIFRETRADFDRDWHPAPRRQFVFVLDGQVELKAGDGTTRQLGPGDLMLLEDTTGRGHGSRVIGGRPLTTIFVTLD